MGGIFQEEREDGRREGFQQGRQEALREGLLKAIQFGLELKFGVAGLALLFGHSKNSGPGFAEYPPGSPENRQQPARDTAPLGAANESLSRFLVSCGAIRFAITPYAG